MIIKRKPLSKLTKEKIGFANSGPKNGMWGGGKTRASGGYVLIKVRNHPFANSSGYVLEHRLVMEKFLNRYITDKEIVHHINGIKNDNRPENLEVMSQADHMREHKLKRIKINCPNCGKLFERRPCEIKTRKRNFCSVPCSSKFYMKDSKSRGFDRTGTHWKKVGGKRIFY